MTMKTSENETRACEELQFSVNQFSLKFIQALYGLYEIKAERVNLIPASSQ